MEQYRAMQHQRLHAAGMDSTEATSAEISRLEISDSKEMSKPNIIENWASDAFRPSDGRISWAIEVLSTDLKFELAATIRAGQSYRL